MPQTSPLPPMGAPRTPTRWVRPPRTPLGWLFAALAGLVVVAALAVAPWLVWPDVAHLATENPGRTAFMAFREARERDKGKPYGVTQQWVPLPRISQYVVMAVTIAEDDAFWSHDGFDTGAMWDALERNVARGEIKAGGSTITQQLAKNLFFTPERSLLRKAREAVVAARLERALTKKRILELYLNVAEWGRGVFGIEAAARHYFGVSAAGLSQEQAARLAAVLPSPLRWNPAGDSRVVQKRARIILGRMMRRLGDGQGRAAP
ncbi:MAG: monofunctional biosynthetic peptidoglycan transglycosylase [Desulfovibrionaceae bacterium]